MPSDHHHIRSAEQKFSAFQNPWQDSFQSNLNGTELKSTPLQPDNGLPASDIILQIIE